MKFIWLCLFSPRLYKIYKDGPRESLYQPHALEKWGDKIITSAKTVLSIGYYACPLIGIYIYNKRSVPFLDSHNFLHILGGIGSLLAISILIRSIGRVNNSKYMEFLTAITSSTTDHKKYLDSVRKYDFDFSAWPVTYSVSPKPRLPFYQQHPFLKCANNDFPAYKRIPIQILAYLATRIFALSLIYPGSLRIMQVLVGPALLQGRTMLVEQFDGKRTKLQSCDGNTLDTMFVDNRNQSPNGTTLVVCCEGNAGFYEIGIMTTPIKAGFSALGWNHPGFAGSTGSPYPDQEKNAIDVVMHYAVNKLGFTPQNIIIFGWSIGGYSATWAAMSYPEIKGLILDATFDDLLPLARNQMPESWGALVKEVVVSHVDLHIAELLTGFPGPVKLIRRTEDEIICLRQGQLSTNRGNHLLLRLIQARHSPLSDEETSRLLKFVNMSDSQRAVFWRTDLDDINRKLLSLIRKYMFDFRSTHCVPLQEDTFEGLVRQLTEEYS